MAKHMPPQPQAHVPSSSGDNITMAKPSHPKATSTPKHAKRPLNPYKKLQVEATKSKKTEAYPCKRCPYVGINKRASTTHQKSHEVDPAKKRKTSTYQKGLMSISSRKGPEHFGQTSSKAHIITPATKDTISLFGSELSFTSDESSDDELTSSPVIAKVVATAVIAAEPNDSSSTTVEETKVEPIIIDPEEPEEEAEEEEKTRTIGTQTTQTGQGTQEGRSTQTEDDEGRVVKFLVTIRDGEIKML